MIFYCKAKVKVKNLSNHHLAFIDGWEEATNHKTARLQFEKLVKTNPTVKLIKDSVTVTEDENQKGRDIFDKKGGA